MPEFRSEFMRTLHAREFVHQCTDASALDGLAADGFVFYPWLAGGPDCVRLVTAFDTHPSAVESFIASANRHAANPVARRRRDC